MRRRDFVKLTGASALMLGVGSPVARALMGTSEDVPIEVVDPMGLGGFEDHFTLRITPIRLEIAPGRVIETVGYNGSSPGPLLRMRSGVPTALDVYNDSMHSETVHPHGQHVPSAVDGTTQEGSKPVLPGEQRRFIFKPGPAGTRWYHSHAHTNGDRTRGLYTGQQGIVLVEPKHNPAAYDKEVFLITHDWKKFLRQTMGKKNIEGPMFSINGRALGHGEPVRVRPGERVLFRVVNGNAEEETYLALPGHRFQVVALDGNPVPRPASVEVLRLGSGERVDAIVEMKAPGIWVLGETRDKRRSAGMGIVVEYAEQSGSPRWKVPKNITWDYTLFGDKSKPVEPDEMIEMTFDKGRYNGKSAWLVNGKPFEAQDSYKLRQGKRYRLVFRDNSNRLHPLHLHRHSFELTNIEGKPTSGIIKDTVCIEPNGHVEVDFTADQPGLSLLHCHMQNHMDKGFASLFEIESEPEAAASEREPHAS